MAILIGVDEAGYGPNLGPLVIAATCWSIPDAAAVDDVDRLVARRISRTRPAADDGRLWIADSKEVYQPGKGLAGLERSLWPLFSTLGVAPTTFGSLWTAVAPDSAGDRTAEPWYAVDLDLPVDWPADGEHLSQLGQGTAGDLTAAGCMLTSVRARIVSPSRFNARLAETGNKGVVLSETTLNLIASLWPAEFDARTYVYADKHGGRNRYAELLSAVTGERMVMTLSEGAESSRYRIGKTEIRFGVRSERFLPVAMASMIAKYLRELAMRQFNEWWIARIPGLAPTAGYPVDARRFWEATRELRTAWPLVDSDLWRMK